ncbi:hypothetical protein [Aquimarina agarivorans]|uniref:hypothetical protein n=1 Tax=Aquimarina agarivorans TaxID=980584 RepID=UPI000248F611|nr:hypothetical protein [Aquimarina agarivorans]
MKANFFFIFSVFTLSLLAQKPIITNDFNLTVGNKYKRVTGIDEFHFSYGQRFLSLKKLKKGFIVERYSLNDLSKKVKNTSFPDTGDFVSVMQLKDTVQVYYRQKNKLLSRKLRVSVDKIEKPITVIESEEDIADDFGFSGRFGYEAGRRINAFAIKKSVDASKFLILHRKKEKSNETGKAKNVIEIQIFNSDMTLDWKRTMEIPYFFKQVNTDDFMVDHEGNFYVLASKFEKDRVSVGKRNKLDTNFHIEFFKASKDSDTWKISQLDTDFPIEDAVLYASGKNEPVAIGFYGDEEFKGQIVGAFVAKLNGNENIKPVLHRIPNDTLVTYENRRQQQISRGKRGQNDLYDLEKIHINKVMANPDGSYALFAEQRYVLQSSSYINGVNHIHYTSHYRNAYACKIDGSGTVNWFNQLPKNQTGIDGKQSMSFVHQYFGGNHYVLYWDQFKNLRKSIGDYAELLTINRQAYMFMQAYRVNDASGSLDKLPVINAIEVGKHRLSSFEMGKVVPISNDDLVIQGHHGSKSYLFRLRGK